jgi:hypothetical protein
MGKENAGTISPTSPILDSIGRRKPVAYTNDRIKEMILKKIRDASSKTR